MLLHFLKEGRRRLPLTLINQMQLFKIASIHWGRMIKAAQPLVIQSNSTGAATSAKYAKF
jgi:hypothetical protein